MSYFEDLSLYAYSNTKEKCTYNVGWLEGGIEFENGDVPNEFINNLWEYVKYPINKARGFHYDKVLQKGKEKIIAKDGGYNIQLGYAEIRVFDEVNDVVYACPNMILYYVIKLGYRPPECFINAVVTSQKPNTKKYSQLIKNTVFDNYKKLIERESCPFCGERYNTYGFTHTKTEGASSQLELVEFGVGDSYTDNDDYVDVICISCGRKFDKKRMIRSC